MNALRFVVEERNTVLEAIKIRVVLSRFVNNSEAGKRCCEVFPLAVLLAGFSSAKSGDSWDGVEDKVDEGNDDENAERIRVDTDDSDDVCPATVRSNAVGLCAVRGTAQPAEEGEHGSQNLKAIDQNCIVLLVLELTSTPKMAALSWKDGQVP